MEGGRPLTSERVVTACRVCAARGEHKRYRVREMLHGTREVFEYFACAACGCVQIGAVPDDLSRFYPGDYFSFRPHRGLDRNLIRRWIDPHRVKARFGAKDWIGQVAERVSRPLDYIDWVRHAGLRPDARVLDVGCGTGKTLLNMALGGFPEPQGVDPFVAHTLRYRSGVTIHKASLADFAAGRTGGFDFIMFHHSLEHLIDPLESLQLAERLLSPGGRMLVAVPVADCWAWEHYREDWCNLDAPRHIHLLTRPAMDILARAAGLVVRDARSTGNLSQFVRSERYRRDIPACDPRRDRALFSGQQLADFRRRTDELNLMGRGDQAMFTLVRA